MLMMRITAWSSMRVDPFSFFLCVGVWWPSFWGLVFVDTFIIIGIRFGVVESGGWFWVGYGLHYFVSLWVGCLSSMWGGVIWVGTF